MNASNCTWSSSLNCSVPYCYYIYVNNLATEDDDFGSGPYNVTFMAQNTRASFTVPISDDDMFENNENFILTIDPYSLTNNVTISDPDQATVTITDDDCEYFICIATYNYNHGCIIHLLLDILLYNMINIAHKGYIL